MVSRTFLLLQNEAFLLEGCLRYALTALMKSSGEDRGALYAALFSYSTGLERLLKLTLLLDHCIANKGTFPTYTQIKTFGHDVSTLYKSATAVVVRYNIEIPESCRTDDLDERWVELLTGFAVSGRYFNLDALTGSGKSEDPLPEWGKLLYEIYERDVPQLKRISDEEQVDALAHSLKGRVIHGLTTGFDGKVQTYEQFFRDHGKVTLVMPEVVWRFARLLYPFQMLISRLDQPLHSGQAGKPQDFPHMWEICAFCSSDKEATIADIAG